MASGWRHGGAREAVRTLDFDHAEAAHRLDARLHLPDHVVEHRLLVVRADRVLDVLPIGRDALGVLEEHHAEGRTDEPLLDLGA